jgi:hypothetical protein
MSQGDEITEWLSSRGRTALNLEAAKQLAAESPQQWYVALNGSKGYIIGKMTLQKFSRRHIVVSEDGQPMMFPTLESAVAFVRTVLKVDRPHVFNY